MRQYQKTVCKKWKWKRFFFSQFVLIRNRLEGVKLEDGKQRSTRHPIGFMLSVSENFSIFQSPFFLSRQILKYVGDSMTFNIEFSNKTKWHYINAIKIGFRSPAIYQDLKAVSNKEQEVCIVNNH